MTIKNYLREAILTLAYSEMAEHGVSYDYYKEAIRFAQKLG